MNLYLLGAGIVVVILTVLVGRRLGKPRPYRKHVGPKRKYERGASRPLTHSVPRGASSSYGGGEFGAGGYAGGGYGGGGGDCGGGGGGGGDGGGGG